MDVVTLGFALAAGLVAALNPCGFAMLPAYLTLVVVGDDVESRSRAAAVERARSRRRRWCWVPWWWSGRSVSSSRRWRPRAAVPSRDHRADRRQPPLGWAATAANSASSRSARPGLRTAWEPARPTTHLARRQPLRRTAAQHLQRRLPDRSARSIIINLEPRRAVRTRLRPHHRQPGQRGRATHPVADLRHPTHPPDRSGPVANPLAHAGFDTLRVGHQQPRREQPRLCHHRCYGTRPAPSLCRKAAGTGACWRGALPSAPAP